MFEIRKFNDLVEPKVDQVTLESFEFTREGKISFKLNYKENPMQCFWKIKEARYNGKNEKLIKELTDYYHSVYVSSDEGATKLSSELERRYKSIIYKEPFVPLKKNIYLCYDPSWCGTALADNPSGIGNNNEIDKYYDIIRPFEYFKKYYHYRRKSKFNNKNRK